MNMPYADFEPITCYRASGPITVDGRLDEAAWLAAPRSRRFVDAISGGPAVYDTRVATLWDDENLYVGFWCEEPFPRAQLTERDALIWFENDVEVFIDGGDTYYEFEMNARNTVYEVLYIWQDAYTRGSRFDVPEFDLFEHKAITFGGNYDRTGQTFWRGAHPRGLRYVFRDWDLPGLKTAVHVEGALNDPTVVSKGWTAELAFPWSGMHWLANGRPLPPRDGDEWRLLFARYEQIHNAGQDVSFGWALDVVGTGDNHLPERFSRVVFSEKAAGA